MLIKYWGGGETMNNQRGSTTKTVVMAVFVGIVIALGGLIYINNSKTPDNKNMTTAEAETMPNAMTKAADLRAMLTMLDVEHVELASAATRNGFDGNADFEATVKSLDENSLEIAKAVGSVYGAEAENQFLEIWRSHITFFVDYTVAAKSGDKEGMATAVTNLGGYTNAIADFFSKANPNLPREAVHQLISEHVTLLKGTVDAHGAGDYAGSYAKQRETVKQVETIATALAGGIVKQNPDTFK